MASVSVRIAGIVTVMVSFHCASLQANSALSAHGYTGLVNVPSADVTPLGSVELQYNNQLDRSFDIAITEAESILLSFGVWKGLELGGRLTQRGEAGCGTKTNEFRFNGFCNRDLSGNLKYQIPLPASWPSVALGMQDFGGDAVNFRSRYLVATQEWKKSSFSLGYGTGRLNGLFGGVETKVLPHVSALLDYDSVQTSYAVRLDSEELLGQHRINTTVRFKASDTEEEVFVGVGWQTRLAGKFKGFGPDFPSSKYLDDAVRKANFEAGSCESKLLNVFEQSGFEQLRFGQSNSDVLVVQFEDKSFDHSIVDGFGVAMGHILEHCSEDYEHFVIQLNENRAAKYWVASEFGPLRAYFSAATAAEGFDVSVLRGGLGKYPGAVQWQSEATAQKTYVELSFKPITTHNVGTEFGLVDYSLGLDTQARVGLWSGASVYLRHYLPLAESDDFEVGGVFHGGRVRDQLNEVYLTQRFHLSSQILSSTYLGFDRTLGADATTLGQELAWIASSGRHMTLAKYMKFDLDEKVSSVESRDSVTGTYRMNWPEKGLGVDITYGRFLFEDEGLRVLIRKFFADTEVAVFYKNTESGDRQSAGLLFALPFGQRKSMNAFAGVRLKGNPVWFNALQTTINRKDGTNTLDGSIAVELLPRTNLATDYLDRSRLGLEYFRANLHRMRDAWWMYAVH